MVCLIIIYDFLQLLNIHCLKSLTYKKICFAAVVLHQSFASVAPATTVQPTTAPHKDPERPERGIYKVTSSNGTTCLLAYMGLQLNISISSVPQNKVCLKNKNTAGLGNSVLTLNVFIVYFQTVQDVVNIKPNQTTTSGSCEADTASLLLLIDSGKTNLTFVFSLVR